MDDESDVRRRLVAPRFGLSARAWQALVVVLAVALLARLFALGARTAHFDEGRVAYWTLRYAETGHFQYRYIIHGPFVQHVGSVLFGLLGATDFVMRLPVALIGGLFPLSALLLRDHLRDGEVVGLALFLALNPVLLYYSRFFRSDVPVAAFAFVAFGLAVRLHATRRPRYLHAAAAFAALSFASKENAAVYLLVWIGAGALLVDTALFRPRAFESGAARLRAAAARQVAFVRETPRRAAEAAARVVGHLTLAVLLFAAITLFMYAPRAGSVGGVGLWAAVSDPTLWPAVVDATVADLNAGFEYWLGQSGEPGCGAESFAGGYLCFLGRFVGTMGRYAAPLSALAVGGFLIERYASADSRSLVMFAGYWGFVSVLGYPLGTDVWGAWLLTHAIVPLAIPAAVGLGHVVRYGAASLRAAREGDDERRIDAGVAGLVVLLLVGGMVVPGVGAAYVDPHARSSSTDVVQYAQPGQDMRPGLRAMREAVDDGPGVDVVYYGERYYLENESGLDQPPPAGGTGNWFHRLPLPWYTEASGAEVASAKTLAGLDATLADDPPVIVAQKGFDVEVRRAVDGDYRTFEYDLRAPLSGPDPGTTVVVFVDESRLDDEPDESRPSGESYRANGVRERPAGGADRPLAADPPTHD